jgi:LysM repeat protein
MRFDFDTTIVRTPSNFDPLALFQPDTTFNPTISFYIIDPAGSELRLPVNPEEISIRREKLFETVNIVSLGEIDFTSKGTKISEISFTSFFPGEYDPSYCNYSPVPSPIDAAKQLNDWAASNKPVRLLITGMNVNQLVLLSAHTSSIRGTDPGDIFFELTFRSWRPVQIRADDQKQSNRPDLKPVEKVHIVKQGECLWKIAKQELGNSGRWQDIYAINVNKKTIGPDPNLIYPKQRLVMPA